MGKQSKGRRPNRGIGRRSINSSYAPNIDQQLVANNNALKTLLEKMKTNPLATLNDIYSDTTDVYNSQEEWLINNRNTEVACAINNAMNEAPNVPISPYGVVNTNSNGDDTGTSRTRAVSVDIESGMVETSKHISSNESSNNIYRLRMPLKVVKLLAVLCLCYALTTNYSYTDNTDSSGSIKNGLFGVLIIACVMMSGRGLRGNRSNTPNLDLDSATISAPENTNVGVNNSNTRRAESQGSASPTKGNKNAPQKTDELASPSAARRDDTNLLKIFINECSKDHSQLVAKLQIWKDNNALDDLLKAGGFEFNGTDDLEELARKLTELSKLEATQYFCGASTLTCDVKYLRVLVLLHFPPNNQECEKVGTLYTNGNSIPQNPTIKHLFRLIVVVLTEQYHISPRDARFIAIHSFLVADVIPITLDPDAADGDGTDEYKNAKERTKAASISYIKHLVEKIDFTHAMMLGVYPLEFGEDNKKELFGSTSIEVLQDFNLFHTSKVAMGYATERELFELMSFINELVADLLEEKPKDFDYDIFKRIINDNDIFGCEGNGDYIYEGYLGDKLVLIGRNGDHTQSLIGELLGGRWFSFPKQEKINNGKRFKGMTIKLVHFSEFDYENKQFGTIECEVLRSWAREHYRDIEQEFAEHSEKCESAHDSMLGAM